MCSIWSLTFPFSIILYRYSILREVFGGSTALSIRSFASRSFFNQSRMHESVLSVSSARIAPQFESPRMTSEIFRWTTAYLSTVAKFQWRIGTMFPMFRRMKSRTEKSIGDPAVPGYNDPVPFSVFGDDRNSRISR